MRASAAVVLLFALLSASGIASAGTSDDPDIRDSPRDVEGDALLPFEAGSVDILYGWLDEDDRYLVVNLELIDLRDVQHGTWWKVAWTEKDSQRAMTVSYTLEHGFHATYSVLNGSGVSVEVPLDVHRAAPGFFRAHVSRSDMLANAGDSLTAIAANAHLQKVEGNGMSVVNVRDDATAHRDVPLGIHYERPVGGPWQRWIPDVGFAGVLLVLGAALVSSRR